MNHIQGDLSEVMKSLDSKYHQGLEQLESKLELAIRNSSGNLNVENLEALQQEFQTFKTSFLDMFSEVKSLMAAIVHRQDEAEMYSRRNCLVIHGIKEVDNEVVEDIAVTELNRFIKLPNWSLNKDMIDRCHRLGPKNRRYSHAQAQVSRPRSIVVKFIAYFNRNVIWSNKKCFKGSNINVTESLTQTRAKVYQEAKTAFGVSNVWTRDGRVCVKHEDKIQSISTMIQLKLLIQNAIGLGAGETAPSFKTPANPAAGEILTGASGAGKTKDKTKDISKCAPIELRVKKNLRSNSVSEKPNEN